MFSTICKKYFLGLCQGLAIYTIFVTSRNPVVSEDIFDDLKMSDLESPVNFSRNLPCTRAYDNDGKLHVVCSSKGLKYDRLSSDTAVLEIHCAGSEMSMTKLNLYRLEELILDTCSTLQMSDDVFVSTPEVTKVLIKSAYNIVSFPQILSAISYLSRLKSLTLDKCSGFKRLQRRDMALLKRTSLEKLEVIDCQIESVDRDAFEDLKTITSFDFSSNPLSEAALGNITVSLKDREIHRLAVRHLSRIKELPLGTIMLLRHSLIQHLDLSDNNIPKLQPESLAFENLKFLKLTNSKISYIHPLAFKGSLKLESMDLKGNYLASIENQLDQLTNLTIIDLSKQNLDERKELRFTVAENGLSSLKNLEVLSLNEAPFRGNIKRFTFNGLVSLNKLELSRSSIEYITDFAFESMGNLRLLDLSFNNIEKLGPNVFYNLENLSDLDLKWNRLTLEEIDGDPNNTCPFSYLKSLQALNLDHNIIRYLSPKALRPLLKLHFLSIKQNRLKSWYEESFPSRVAIRQLLLSHNEIEIISVAMMKDFSRLHKMEVLDLSSNPFYCGDCSVYEFWNWASQSTLRVFPDFSFYTCSSPVEYKGRNIGEGDLFHGRCESATTVFHDLNSTTSSTTSVLKEKLGENDVTKMTVYVVSTVTCSMAILVVVFFVATYRIHRRKKTVDPVNYDASLCRKT